MNLIDMIFGSSDKTSVIPADQLILKRSPELSAFASYFYDPVVLGLDVKFGKDENGNTTYTVEPSWDKLARMEKAREDYLNAYDNYGQRLQKRLGLLENTLNQSLNYLPTISTPFGDLAAYGLQRAKLQNDRAMLGNEGLFANYMKEALISPKQTFFDVLYQQPLNMFMQQDLARNRVYGQPVVERGSGGLLGSALGIGLGALAGGFGYKAGGMLANSMFGG